MFRALLLTPIRLWELSTAADHKHIQQLDEEDKFKAPHSVIDIWIRSRCNQPTGCPAKQMQVLGAGTKAHQT